MADFTEKLQTLAAPKAPSTAALTFLSDLSLEDRIAFHDFWPGLPVERRRKITGTLATLAEDNIELYFRAIFLITLEDSDPQVRLSSIEGLFEDESKVLLGRLLVTLRNDPDEDVRAAAAIALGRFTYHAQCGKLGEGNDTTKLKNTLVEAARDENEEDEVRRRATESLGYLNGDKDVQEIIEAAYKRGGRDAESAVFAMGRNIDTRWQQTIMNELQSDAPAMRYEAARAAGEMALEDALSYLIPMVEDDDSEVRLASVWALGQIGGRPAAEALARAMQSTEPALRDAAKEAMEEVAFSANPMTII